MHLITAAVVTALAVASIAPVAADPERARSGVDFELVSVATDGSLVGSPGALVHDVSDDGRYVLMTSRATNLVPNDTIANKDLFLRDRVAGTTVRITQTPDGEESDLPLPGGAAAVSGDGSVVVYNVPTRDGGTWVYDTATGDRSEIAGMPFGSSRPRSLVLSNDGRYIAFDSSGADLVPGDTNGHIDVFVFDRETEQMSLVSRSTDGQIGNGTSHRPRISDDGQRVVFSTFATNFGFRDGDEGYTAYVHELDTGLIYPVSRRCSSLNCDTVRESGFPRISGDGREVFWSSVAEIFTPSEQWSTDLETGVVKRISREFEPAFEALLGDEADGGTFGVSNDRRYLAIGYQAGPDQPLRIYRFDRTTDEIVLITVDPDGQPTDLEPRALRMSGSGTDFVFGGYPAGLYEGLPRVEIVYAATVTEGPRCRNLLATIVSSGTITGTDGDDVIIGSSGPDTINSLAGNDTICAGFGRDTINAGPGDDIVFGDGGNDTINGGPGHDVHVGGNGNDLMFHNAGGDTYRGGPGADTVDYSTAAGPVIVKIDNQAGDGTQGESDNVTASVENVIGSAFGDLIVGSVEANRLDGGAGDDVIRGRAGDDTLIGGPGNDILQGNSGLDLIDAGTGDDRLIGGPNNDTLRAGDGNDYCRGSAGFDAYFNCETADP